MGRPISSNELAPWSWSIEHSSSSLLLLCSSCFILPLPLSLLLEDVAVLSWLTAVELLAPCSSSSRDLFKLAGTSAVEVDEDADEEARSEDHARSMRGSGIDVFTVLGLPQWNASGKSSISRGEGERWKWWCMAIHQELGFEWLKVEGGA